MVLLEKKEKDLLFEKEKREISSFKISEEENNLMKEKEKFFQSYQLLKEKYNEVLEKENLTEKEIEEIEKKEKEIKDYKEKGNVEKIRQNLEEKRREKEKERWKIEEEMKEIKKKYKEITAKLDNLKKIIEQKRNFEEKEKKIKEETENLEKEEEEFIKELSFLEIEKIGTEEEEEEEEEGEEEEEKITEEEIAKNLEERKKEIELLKKEIMELKKKKEEEKEKEKEIREKEILKKEEVPQPKPTPSPIIPPQKKISPPSLKPTPITPPTTAPKFTPPIPPPSKHPSYTPSKPTIPFKKEPISFPIPPEKEIIKFPKESKFSIKSILFFIFLLGIISSLIYFFKNYKPTPSLTVPPLPPEKIVELPQPQLVFHKKCQEQKCVIVEGEGEDTCQEDKDCIPKPQPLPVFAIGVFEEIELNNLTFEEFLPLLDEFFKKEYPPKTFIEIIPKFNKERVNINQLFEILGFEPPLEIKENVEDYTLYLYSQQELFNQLRRNRLGIAFGIKSEKIETVKETLRKWEEKIIDDLEKIHRLWRRGRPKTSHFVDNTHLGILIRYINFPFPDLAIDLAIVKDVLLITTSRESMWISIEVLQKAT